MPKFILLKTILLLAISYFVFPPVVFGIAMVTEPIVFKDVMRNSEITTSLYLINSENLANSKNNGVTYQLKAEGEIADWVKFYKSDDKKFENPIPEINIPFGGHAEPVVLFSIPNARKGTKPYTGAIVIMQLADDAKGAGINSNVAMSVSRNVSITMSDSDKGTIKFDTTIAPLKYTVASGKPMQFKVFYNNQGNVSINPDIQFKVTNATTGALVGNTVIYPYPDNERAVMPFERKELANLIEWPTVDRENGNYIVNAKVLLDGNTMSEQNINFTIGNEIVVPLSANLSNFSNNKTILMASIMGAGLLLAAGLFIAKKKFSKKQITT
jgi:hypothetical protein